jgi:UDP-N-acetylmuramoyl-tripeptide--D-alanyl-D-alanine ligase
VAEAAEIRLTGAWVADSVRAAKGRVIAGDPATLFGGVSIDTRTLAPGELFVAIRGDRFDGAEFAAAAIACGATGVVVPEGHGAAVTDTGAVVIEVDDTVRALQELARTVRRASGAKVVAITGSAGKTTTKEVTSRFLAERYRVIRNRGNLNNHIGLPLSLIELRHRPEIAVVELGMNHAGEISTLVAVAEPDVRVWTNVGEAHLGFFASVDAIADAKAEIFEGASRSALLVANADDARIVARLPRFGGRVMTFGVEHDAAVRATAVEDRGIDGTSAHVSTPAGDFDLTTPLVGRGNLANVLAATAVAVAFDVPLAAIARDAAALQPASHRGEILRLSNGVTVIDDSYNANPSAMRRALAALKSSAAAGRRVAVLGEMLELGEHALALHEEVGRTAAESSVDLLITVGNLPAAALGEAAAASGLAGSCVHHVETSEEAAALAADLVRPGDLVLVKGSRGIGTERVVERIEALGTERG